MESPRVTGWGELYSDFTLARAAHAEETARRQAAQAARRAYDTWADWAASELERHLYARAHQRASDFERATAQAVRVDAAANAPIQLGDEARLSGLLSLRLGGAQVDVYTHRKSGTPPTLHFMVVKTGRPGSAGRPDARQLVSTHACTVFPLAQGGYALRLSDAFGGETADIDRLLLLAFQLLVRAYRR
ncbi:MAG TPA: hypothetical protein VKZ49_17360 [Polyangiaceae bacterium]|nr:hypothetical protein [Polyangiaceae bacterium]